MAMVRQNLFGHFETTISEYEKEIGRKRKLLEMIKHPDLKRQRTGVFVFLCTIKVIFGAVSCCNAILITIIYYYLFLFYH